MTARVRVRAVAATALIALGVPVVGVGHAAACAGRAVGRWAPLAPPPGGSPRQVLPLRATCALLAVGADGTVWRSADGAGYARSALPAADRAFADAATGTVVVAAAGALLVSRDDGRTFRAAGGVPVVGTPVAIAVSPDAASLLVATVAAGVTTLWRGTGDGANLAPYDTVPAPATALAYDPWSPGVLWLSATGPTGGVWTSTDGGGTWTQSLAADARDLDVAARPAGSLVVAATATGVWWRSTDAPAWTRSTTVDAAAVRVDGTGTAVVAVSGRRPVRVAGAGAAPFGTGLPSGCAASALAADAAAPRTFTLRCGDGWYALVSAAGAAGAGDVRRPPADAAATPLTVLRRLALPKPDGAASGSLAFDGHALYYAGGYAPGHVDPVHLMSPVDGRDFGTLQVGGTTKFLGYDSRHDRLSVDDEARMWWFDLRTRRRRPAFAPTYTYQNSFDAATRTFVGVFDGDDAQTMRTLDEHGRLRATCTIPSDRPLTEYPSTVMAPTTPSAVAAAPDGAYVVLEDDRTIVRLSRGCVPQARYAVHKFSESELENDQLACDAFTFAPRTALWIRDSGLDTVTAYDLPGGYCPFVSALRVTVPRLVAGASGRACATLRGAGRGDPVAGAAVSFDLAGVLLAAPPTDSAGRSCVRVTAPAQGAVPLRARFAGTPRWTPASDTAAVLASAPVVPRRVRVRTAPGIDAARPAAALVAAALPVAPPNAPPEPLPGHQPQPNAQPQQHPDPQPGAQAGFAPEPDAAPDLVLAEEGEATYAMSAPADPHAVALLLGAALLTAAAGAAARSHLTPEPAVSRAGRGRPRGPRRRGHAVRRGRR